MTENQFRRALKQLGLTQIAAGQLFQVGARTARRWALGESPVPPPVVILLRLLIKKRIKVEDILTLE